VIPSPVQPPSDVRRRRRTFNAPDDVGVLADEPPREPDVEVIGAVRKRGDEVRSHQRIDPAAPDERRRPGRAAAAARTSASHEKTDEASDDPAPGPRKRTAWTRAALATKAAPGSRWRRRA
jgi:hypothetical protein